MRRRPAPLSGPQPPERLVRYVAEEWPDSPLDPFVPLEAWIAARKAWLADHPGSQGFGDALDVIRCGMEERRAIVLTPEQAAHLTARNQADIWRGVPGTNHNYP